MFKKRGLPILAGGVFVFALLYYLIVLSPVLARDKAALRHIKKKESDLQRITELRRDWEAFQEIRAKAEDILNQRGKEFKLLSYLEGISREVGIDRKIQYIKPISFTGEGGPLKPEGIEMKLDDIDIRQLIHFLTKIEYARKLLNIQRIKIMPAEMGKIRSLGVTLQVNTYASG